MKNTILIQVYSFALIASLSLQSVIAQEQVASNFVAPANIKIDGNPQEWAGKPMATDKSGIFDYLFANDTKNLYVVIRTADMQMQMKIMIAGITISVNDKGKRKETYSMTFPLMDQTAARAQMKTGTQPEGGGKPDPKALRQRLLSQMNRIGVKGFERLDAESVSIFNTIGFKAALDFDDKDNLYYEAAIPLSSMGINPAQKEELAYNIKINGMKAPEAPAAGAESGASRPSGSGGGGGRGGRGGGGGMGGRGGGGGRGGSTANMGDLAKSTDFWVEQSLAH